MINVFRVENDSKKLSKKFIYHIFAPDSHVSYRIYHLVKRIYNIKKSTTNRNGIDALKVKKTTKKKYVKDSALTNARVASKTSKALCV